VVVLDDAQTALVCSTTLVEAALTGRRAVGVELEARWADLAQANADHVLVEPAARRLVDIRQGDATKLARLLAPDAGRVDLVAPHRRMPATSAI
jgi:modification methylase